MSSNLPTLTVTYQDGQLNRQSVFAVPEDKFQHYEHINNTLGSSNICGMELEDILISHGAFHTGKNARRSSYAETGILISEEDFDTQGNMTELRSYNLKGQFDRKMIADKDFKNGVVKHLFIDNHTVNVTITDFNPLLENPVGFSDMIFTYKNDTLVLTEAKDCNNHSVAPKDLIDFNRNIREILNKPKQVIDDLQPIANIIMPVLDSFAIREKGTVIDRFDLRLPPKQFKKLRAILTSEAPPSIAPSFSRLTALKWVPGQ